ncbi:helix-turn-helix domain-containing protein [Actinosynnema sp. NPDC020468]|uniref:PucR family transcriptional regulator n=1 Tax=Actinosynnema sp. NPDC020468 TaxID=3154488 RepID=UPI0033C007EB
MDDRNGPPWQLGTDADVVRGTLEPECRSGLLAMVAPGGERLVLLVPAHREVRAAEAKSLANRALRGLEGAGRQAVATVARTRGDHGLGAAVKEAHSIMRVVRALEYGSGAYLRDDVIIETALLRSPDLTRLLSDRIAPLAHSNAPLLDTLSCFLACGQDRRKAARQLHIHPNTLIYRLRRIRELTGLSPTVPRDIQTLGAAVAARRLNRTGEPIRGATPGHQGRTTAEC